MAYLRPVYERNTPRQDQDRPIGYEVRYRDGQGRQRTKGGFRRKRDAEQFANEIEVARHQGTLINPQQANVSFASVADSWLVSIEGRRKPRTVDGYRKLVDLHLRPVFGSRKVASISYADVDGLLRSLEALGRKGGTVRNTFFVLKMVLDYAIRDGRIRANPCSGVELPSAASPEMLFLCAAEVRALAETVDRLSAGRTAGNGIYGLLVEFAAFTGLRAGEIGALRVRDLDLREGLVRVERSVARVGGSTVVGGPKTRAGRRTVVMPRFITNRIRTHLDGRELDRDAPLFLDVRGRPVNYGTFYGLYFKPAVREALPAHLHGLRFHDLKAHLRQLLGRTGRPSQGDGRADGSLVGADHPRPLCPRHAAAALSTGGAARCRLRAGDRVPAGHFYRRPARVPLKSWRSQPPTGLQISSIGSTQSRSSNL